jgi:hypothetical protein
MNISDRRPQLWLIALSIVALSSLVARAAALHSWSLSTTDGAFLTLGAPDSPEETEISFSCEKPNGKVRVFVAETSERFKPKQRATAVFSVGSVERKVPGKFVPNEDAGVASFQGELAADNAIFRALRGSERLTIRIGAWKHSFEPLGDDDKASRFAAACRKAE